MSDFILILVTLSGTLLGSLLSVLPALHIYNVIGLLLLLYIKFFITTPVIYVVVFMLGMLVSYSFLNTIPSVYLGAPDESTVFMLLPGLKYMFLGRGWESVILTGVGSLMAIILMVLGLPFLLPVLRSLRIVLAPHLYWLLGIIIVYLILSEFPKGTDRAVTRMGRFLDAWKSILAGLLTFILSGLLGIFIFNKPVVNIEFAFQNIMPAFVGLFAVPWILTNLVSRVKIPPQYRGDSLDAPAEVIIKGGFAGFLGGGFAALFPLVTAGIGGLLAGHATAQRDDRIFILSYGTCKTVYYVGAFLLFFVPGLNLTRGGLSWMLSSYFKAGDYTLFYKILGLTAIAGAFSFFLLIALTDFFTKKVLTLDYKKSILPL